MVERNLAKVEVESSRLFCRSSFYTGREKRNRNGSVFVCVATFVLTYRRQRRRVSKEVMQRIANPFRAVRFRYPPPIKTTTYDQTAQVNFVLGYTGATLRVARLSLWQIHVLVREEFFRVTIIDSESMRFVLPCDARVRANNPLVSGVTKRYCNRLQCWQNGT